MKILLSILGGIGCVIAVFFAACLFIVFLRLFAAMVSVVLCVAILIAVFSFLIYKAIEKK